MKLTIEIDLDNEEAQTALEEEYLPMVVWEYLQIASSLVDGMYEEGCFEKKDTRPGTFVDGNGVRIGKVWFSF